MKKELFSNFTYKLINNRKESFYTVEVKFLYRNKPILYKMQFDRKEVKANQVVNLAKKKINEEIENKQLKKYANHYLDTTHQRALPKWARITLITVGSIVGVIGLALAGINSFKYLIWKDYYAARVNIAHNPGLNDGAVPQGIAVMQNEDLIFTSCYMADQKSASRIYITKDKKELKYVELYDGGHPFLGHVGGLTVNDDKRELYVANIDYKVYVLSIDDLLKQGKVEVGKPVSIGNPDGNGYGNAGDYIFAGDWNDSKPNYIYVGEFNNNKEYPRKNTIGNYHAAVYRYDASKFVAGASLNEPNLIYAVPDKVQGFVITPEGNIILSTSWGISSSHYYVYSKERIDKCDTVEYGDKKVNAIILTEPTKDIKGPPMAEDLAYKIKDKLVYNMNESASNKYIFGKFLFDAGEIIGLKL